ncbi:MAG: hypothetical protein PHO76_02630 [Methylotenera sp.]|nr:hypothetical protein [Methylotenera sp.]MDD4927239.1 hypothetical protein [Methylotenera sp.]
MVEIQKGAVTDTGEKVAVIFTDIDAVKLYMGLKRLNDSIAVMGKAGMLSKAAAAERVMSDARDLMEQTVFTLHAALDEIERVKEELARIGNIGVIKNG